MPFQWNVVSLIVKKDSTNILIQSDILLPVCDIMSKAVDFLEIFCDHKAHKIISDKAVSQLSRMSFIV